LDWYLKKKKQKKKTLIDYSFNWLGFYFYKLKINKKKFLFIF
jgi:hypothetical protein